MATQLGLYNGALRLIKHRSITTLSDDVEARYLLDDAYAGAVAVCLELAQWNFAARSSSIVTAATPGFGYARSAALPSDFVRFISVSASSSHFPPLEDYGVFGTSVYAADTTLYVSYVSDGASYGGNLAAWPETFARLVEAQLAREVGPHLTSGSEEITKAVESAYRDRFRIAIAKDAVNRTARVLSSTTLAVYNGALRLLGERVIENFSDSTITDRMVGIEADPKERQEGAERPTVRAALAREALLRRLLDEAYTRTVDYCLELGQWSFASRTTTSTGTATPAYGFTKTHTLPSDFVRLIAISASANFYPPHENNAVAGGALYANDTTLYLSYVSKDDSYGRLITRWPETFTRLVEAQLAMEIAPHVDADPDAAKRIASTLSARLRHSLAKDAINKTVRTVSTATLGLYNGALRILGQRFLENHSDDVVLGLMPAEEGEASDGQKVYRGARDPSVKTELVLRRLLDESYDDSLDYMLSQGLWNFGLRTVMVEASTDVEPAFGHTYAFEKPDDFIRLNAISVSEMFDPTLDNYTDEGQYWFASVNPIYVSFVSDGASYGGDVASWPPYYKRAVEFELAYRIMNHVPGISSSRREEIRAERQMAMRDARAKDAMNQPVSRPPPGRLVMARTSGTGGGGSPWWR